MILTTNINNESKKSRSCGLTSGRRGGSCSVQIWVFNVCLCFGVVELFFVFTTIEVVSKSGVAHKCKLFPFGFGANGRG